MGTFKPSFQLRFILLLIARVYLKGISRFHKKREEDLRKKNWSNQYENPQSAHQSAFLNLALPGQHPNPEVVVQEVHRKVYASLARRQMLQGTQKYQDSSCLIGNPIDDCWECDPNWPDNRQNLADCAIGFGQYALGGKGGEYDVVTDSSNDDAVNPRPGTLRYAVIQTEPLWIVFPGNMLIKLSQELIFNSCKTLNGSGANVHIVGGGCITLQFISNVIIHNVHIHHCYPSGDANVCSSPTHYGYRTKSDGF
ncbi:probable pectate lyase 12 isoform X2 [Prunus avium]|uniref:Probable pectate lyase 12 isoform X2 n=1 Tax=Prunus avium TaxID=42229 RepID=A0A6P5S7E4_PRUAV|nr:probable pectate lyase 12 isoform X2 [Prunus avium]XP_021812919.1 probable pectate lyase 12 isoform X2 [Prunus avium]XP_021812920.1 probable pectate lyase 12 isoform X2 [Prunus avium]XP_021812921.1 probable pectate lyase 12 isoform X2 [Prunus avium]